MRPRTVSRASTAAPALWIALLASGGIALAGCAYALERVQLIAPGMNQTELQSVMGPPDYIQLKGMRQAWQYCPHFFGWRGDLYVTVWFRDGRVEHMRAYEDRIMGSCEDFLAAFRWEDVIEDEYRGLGK